MIAYQINRGQDLSRKKVERPKPILTSEEMLILKNRFPSLYWVPNIAQERAFKTWMDPDSSMWPRVHVVTYGNRTGKTDWLAEILCGAAKGGKWVNQQYCRMPLFDAFDFKRKNRLLTIWWVCDGEMMKGNGPDFKAIKKHIPDAMFKAKMNNGVFREIHIPAIDKDGEPFEIIVSVKTHDMDALSYAGDNVDLILCDEPLPQDKWGELSGRMVNLAGEVGGRIIIGATPLKMAGYLGDMLEDPESSEAGRVVHNEGSIWENCVGHEVPDEEGIRLGMTRSPDGKGWITRGHLSAEGIKNAIQNWKASGDPDEVAARRDGKFTHVQGRIYKIFFPDAHIIDPYEIPESYPIVHVVDPHDARPDACGWYVITPKMQLICIAEYPTKPFELITGRSETIAQICDLWRNIESTFKGRVALRIGDPNKMNDPDPATNLRLRELYATHGFVFDTNVIDNLDYGHELVRQALYFDKEKFMQFPGEPMYRPRLMFFSTCRNHKVFMQKYTMQKWKDPSKPMPTKIDQVWKDFPDLVRYLIVKMQEWSFYRLKEEVNGSGGDWQRIKESRRPSPGSKALTGSIYGGPKIPMGAR
jgi:hypothetical protein